MGLGEAWQCISQIWIIHYTLWPLVMNVSFEVPVGSPYGFERQSAIETERPRWHYFPLILFALHLAGILMMEEMT